MVIRALEFYSGIGGLHRALELSNIDAHVVQAFDWDQLACRVYGANNGEGIVKKVDISTVHALSIRGLNAPLWLLSPSCQPYTILNPTAKGAEDPRAKSFLHLVERVLPDLAELHAAPKWILIENVSGFEASATRRTLLDQLSKFNYTVMEFLLTPLQFGIPDSRLRYYLLAKLRPLSFPYMLPDRCGAVLRHIPGNGVDWVDDRDSSNDLSVHPIRDYLDFGVDNDDDHGIHPCNIPDRVLEKWGRLFDIVLPSARRSCCFTRGYTQMVERAGSILQMNEDLDTSSTFDAFLSLQARFPSNGSDNSPASANAKIPPVHTLYPLRLRYFTSSELLRLFHFVPPLNVQESVHLRGRYRTFVWPSGVSEKSKYRLLGNSVNVEVVRQLINYLFEGDIC